MVEIREHDTWIVSSESIGADGSISKILNASGSDRITGIVDRSSGYSVDIEHLDNEENSVNLKEDVVSASTTGQAEFDEDAHSNKIKVTIEDDSSSSDTADAMVKLR